MSFIRAPEDTAVQGNYFHSCDIHGAVATGASLILSKKVLSTVAVIGIAGLEVGRFDDGIVPASGVTPAVSPPRPACEPTCAPNGGGFSNVSDQRDLSKTHDWLLADEP
jgi:hypothetical protein